MKCVMSEYRGGDFFYPPEGIVSTRKIIVGGFPIVVLVLDRHVKTILSKPKKEVSEAAKKKKDE